LLDQLFVEANGLLGNCRPTEGFFDASSSCIPEAPAFFRIREQPIDPSGKTLRKFFGVNRKTCDWIVILPDPLLAR